MNLRKVTPLLVVNRIEACLPLWQGLGLARTVEVPFGGALGFVILSGKGVEVMLQTRASLAEDAASVAARAGASLLYCDVTSLAEARARAKVQKAEILIDERVTSYGARELWVADGSGHVVGFAEHAKG